MKVIENGAKVIEKSDEPKQTKYYEPSENEKELISFIIDHTVFQNPATLMLFLE